MFGFLKKFRIKKKNKFPLPKDLPEPKSGIDKGPAAPSSPGSSPSTSSSSGTGSGGTGPSPGPNPSSPGSFGGSSPGPGPSPSSTNSGSGSASDSNVLELKNEVNFLKERLVNIESKAINIEQKVDMILKIVNEEVSDETKQKLSVNQMMDEVKRKY